MDFAITKYGYFCYRTEIIDDGRSRGVTFITNRYLWHSWTIALFDFSDTSIIGPQDV